MLLYLVWDATGFWTVLLRNPPSPPAADGVLHLRFLGRVDGVDEGLEAVESLNAWLAAADLARVRPSQARALEDDAGGRLHLGSGGGLLGRASLEVLLAPGGRPGER